MKLSKLFTSAPAVVLGCLALRASAYFVITEPSKTTAWTNGAPNLVTWTKGVADGIGMFDIEMSRMSSDGLTFVARNVPTYKTKSINIFLQDVPAGDDYFLLFINATNGIMYSISPRFTVLPSGASVPSNATHPSADGSAATVTVSGAPNPTALFATTFPVSSGALQRWRTLPAWTITVVTLGSLMGAALVVW